MGLISLLVLCPLMAVTLGITLLLPLLEIAMNMVVTFLLVVNLFVLIVLLVFRRSWKGAGRLEQDYIDGLEGWRRYGALAVKYLLIVAPLWEGLVVLLCAAYLFF